MANDGAQPRTITSGDIAVLIVMLAFVYGIRWFIATLLVIRLFCL